MTSTQPAPRRDPGEPGSEAVFGPPGDVSPPARRGEPDEAHYHFPVEIEVVGAVDGDLVDQVVAQVYEGLARELASRRWG